MASENGTHAKINTYETCPSCGLKWVDHMGVIFVCAENQRLIKENERLKSELKKVKHKRKKNANN